MTATEWKGCDGKGQSAAWKPFKPCIKLHDFAGPVNESGRTLAVMIFHCLFIGTSFQTGILL